VPIYYLSAWGVSLVSMAEVVREVVMEVVMERKLTVCCFLM
jgi:hypothetical protein